VSCAPLLVVHGERDEIVPLLHAEELFEAAPDPKELHASRASGTTSSPLGGTERDAVSADFVARRGR
jgi:alpha-beta hydrolase superfamily lysophospholipase